MEVTDSGSVMDGKRLQDWNEYRPIEMSLVEIVTDVNLVNSENV